MPKLSPRKKLFTLYNRFDRWMSAGDFERLDRVLSRAPIHAMTDTMALGFIAATFPARHKLKNWNPLRNKLQELFTERHGVEEAVRLLRGLKL